MIRSGLFTYNFKIMISLNDILKSSLPESYYILQIGTLPQGKRDSVKCTSIHCFPLSGDGVLPVSENTPTSSGLQTSSIRPPGPPLFSRVGKGRGVPTSSGRRVRQDPLPEGGYVHLLVPHPLVGEDDGIPSRGSTLVLRRLLL